MPKWTRQQLDAIFKKSRGRCKECDHQHQRGGHGKYWQVDHIFPVSRGGTDELNNLAVACKRCNASKGAGVSIVDVMDSLTGNR